MSEPMDLPWSEEMPFQVGGPAAAEGMAILVGKLATVRVEVEGEAASFFRWPLTRFLQLLAEVVLVVWGQSVRLQRRVKMAKLSLLIIITVC